MKSSKSIKADASNPYFYALFAKITFFLTLSVLVLSIFLYVNFKNYSFRLLNTSNEKLMEQIFHNAMQINANVKTYVTALFNSPDAAQLMYGESIPVVDTLNSLRSLDISLGSAPFIYSAYVYNGRTETYYSIGPDPIIRQGDFYDKEIVRLLGNGQKLLSLVPTPRKIPASEANPNRKVNVYTYVLPEYFADGKKVKNALVINVKMDWIFNTLTSFHDSNSLNGNNILIVDKEGSVIAHSDQEWFLRNLSGEPFMRQIFASGDKSGTLPTDVGGTPSVVTFVSYESPEWTLVNITPYKYIARTVDKVKYITLTIGISMLAVCLITAFLLSRNLYAPIRSLRKSIGQMAGTQLTDKEHRNEFAFFTDTFQSAHSKLSSLEAFRKSNMDALKQKYLKDLLAGKTAKNADHETAFKEFGVPFAPLDSVMIVLLKIDNYAVFCSSYNDRDRTLLKYALLNIAGEVIYPYYRCDFLDAGSDHLAVFLNVEGNVEEFGAQIDRLTACIEDIQSIYAKYCSLSVSAFMSEPADNIREIRGIYEQTLDLSNYRIKYGHGCILSQRRLHATALSSINIDSLTVSQLLDAIKRARLNEALELYRNLISELTDCDYNNIMFVLSYLSSSVFNTLNMMERNGTIAFELDFVSFDRKVKSLETFEQLDSEFSALFRTVAEKIVQNRDDKNEIVVSHAMKYIHSNYADKLLSPNTLADMFKLTPAYLGKLFRERASQSIADYIADVRLAEAKELLRETQLSVDEIIEKIGWENKKYFFTVYKKRFGVTPTEYRLKAKVNEIGKASY